MIPPVELDELPDEPDDPDVDEPELDDVPVDPDVGDVEVEPVLPVPDVLDVPDVVEFDEAFLAPAAAWLTPTIKVAVRATPAVATAPLAIAARRSSLLPAGFSVMSPTMRVRASGPRHHSIKTFLSRRVNQPCPR